MTEFRGKPAYLQLADTLRGRIESGKIPNGAPLPSAAELMKEFGVSSTVVKNGISVLRSEGLVLGHQGKAVFAQYPPVITPPPWAPPLVDAAHGLAEVVQEIAEGLPVDTAKARDALAAWRAAGEQLPQPLRAGLASS
ncbi:winged helix-turn-helix domain-containing protein [Streptomyces cylindrosporus]|uniref:Winged helix-turn-helix domain-containing protein n=1 Tax=Streptomyces cylindrosporus TaxID=2927583 RepID=A0ABS9YG81_9ACTN|nr:winged helix-turn-helix domain-containing protein [Streptomyces cylindrosporus]MCI3276245.1 winged helix-turn-helix domain-containing protein [Streptomyces cylindrosporus]